jgi:hypothetical protein
LQKDQKQVFIRGKLKGSNIIELPEYWDGLVDPETITVTLTQIGSSQDLIVEDIKGDLIVTLSLELTKEFIVIMKSGLQDG